MKKQTPPIWFALAALLSTAPLGLSGEISSSPTTASEATSRHSFLDPLGDFARDSILRPTQPFALIPGKSPNDWSFTIAPYAWAMGLDGNVGVKGLPASSIDYSSRTILQHLDWGIFVQGEVRKGRWGILADGYYAALSASASPDNRIYDNASLSLQQSIISLAVAYRVIDDRRGFLDLYGGVRYNYLGLQADTSLNNSRIDTIAANAANAIGARIQSGLSNASARDLQRALNRNPEIQQLVNSGIIQENLAGGAVDPALRAYVRAELAARADAARQDLREAADQAKEKLSKEIARRIKDKTPTYATGNQYWFDPIIGLRGQVNLTQWLYLAAQGDVGGFGAGSQIAWNVQSAVGVNFTRNIFAELGYRYLYVDYKNGGFLYTMNQYGIFSSVGFNF